MNASAGTTKSNSARIRLNRVGWSGLAVSVTMGLAFLQGGLQAEAADIKWVGYQNGVMGSFPDSGSFFHGDNWLNYVVPGPNDTAIFGAAWTNGNGNTTHRPHTVHFGNFNVDVIPMPNPVFVPGGDVTTRGLEVLEGSWIFDFGSGQTPGAGFAPALTGSYAIQNGRVLIMGSETSDTVLTIRNGSFSPKGPAPFHGALDIMGWNWWIHPARTLGTLVVEGTNAQVHVTNGVNLVNGRVVVQNGAALITDGIYGYEAYVSVLGPGSFVQGLASVRRGELLIDRGARVSSLRLNSFRGDASIGAAEGANSVATAIVKGAGSRWDDINQLFVGGTDIGASIGIVKIQGGGYVSCGRSLIGNWAQPCSGQVLVSGTGSVWTNLYDVVVGHFSRGTASVRDGGRMIANYLIVGDQPGVSGDLEIISGEVLTRMACIGQSNGAVGRVIVSCPDSVWAVGDWLRVGGHNGVIAGGTGVLDVEGGALVAVGNRLELGPLGTIDLRGSESDNIFDAGGGGCIGFGGRVAVGQVDPVTISNSFAHGMVRVGPGGVLAGSGLVLGDVFVSGGTLTPGFSVGTLSVSNGLILNGIVVMELAKSNSPANDQINARSIVLSGTLQVVNTGDPLVAGDVFDLFNTPAFSGSFANVILPPLDAGLIWDTTQLAVDGTIMVLATDGRPLLREQEPRITSDNGQFTLSVTSAGAAPFAYRWQLNGIDIPGETTGTLTLTNVSSAQDGAYRVVISNGAGTVTSGEIVLNFLELRMVAGLSIHGTVGRTYRIEATPDLQNTNLWNTLTDITLPISPYTWVDLDSGTMPRRIYRSVLLP